MHFYYKIVQKFAVFHFGTRINRFTFRLKGVKRHSTAPHHYTKSQWSQNQIVTNAMNNFKEYSLK